MNPNQAIGHYRITAKLGEGGMGEVWRATDTKLNRDVAIKILPAAFAADPDRMARFTREAQVLASLNHPNIAQIYGVEDRALVMELVDGPTLSQRIGQGALPANEALDIARQIGDALEAAHERGVVHRDLKPANIKLTSDGRVKVLDFGLAKAMSGGDGMIGADPANSPTMTMSATAAGVIMGTAGYMAPEQAKGKPVDKRADIWAFGVVLYEMLTAHRLFDGETAAESLAAVLTREPDVEKVPPQFRKLLRSCLEKEPKRRLRDIADAWQLIEEASADAAPATRPRSTLWIAAAAALALIAAAGWWRATRTVDHPLMRLNLDLGPDAFPDGNAGMALSPDGRRIVFVIRRPDGKTQLALRSLDQAQPTLLPGTEEGHQPFFSHDGQWIGFFAGFNMKKITVQGGAPVTVAAMTGNSTGGSWDDDGNIVTALSHSASLSVIPASGSAPRPLTKLAETEQSHRWPQILPGGKNVLFTASSSISGMENANIVAADMKSGEIKPLVRGGYFGRYLPGGFLTYIHAGVLFAARFDVSRLQVQGAPIPMIENVSSDSAFGDGWMAFSEAPAGAGTLVHLAGRPAAQSWRFTLIDSQQSHPLIPTPAAYYNPRFSPDGRRIAFAMGAEGTDIFVYDIARAAMSRLTSNSKSDGPVWTPDGTRIAYNSPEGMSWIRSDGSSDPEVLIAGKKPIVPWSFSPDGRKLAYFEVNPETTYDIGILPFDWSDAAHPKPGTPQPFLRTPVAEACPQFSPDGRWIAYSSNESGTNEVYVRPAEGAGKWQISNGGAMWAFWTPKGNQLYFESLAGHIQVVDYSVSGATFEAGKPQLWSDRQLQQVFRSNIALAPDGQHFAVFEPVEASKTAPNVAVLLNFLDELKRRLP